MMNLMKMRLEDLISMEIDMENHLQVLMQQGQQVQAELAKVKAEKVRRNNILIEKKRATEKMLTDVQVVRETKEQAKARDKRGK